MKNSTEIALLRLLRVALGSEDAVLFSGLETVSWQELYAFARKQGVLAIAFDGLLKLFEQNAEFAKSFPQPLKLQWINAVFSIERRYDHSLEVCAELAEKWAENNIRTLCLKGLAFSAYYPVSNHRECGDFDCYLFDDYAKGNAIARELGAKVDESMYKHSEMIIRKVMVENHRFIVAVRGGRKVKQLHHLLDDIARNDVREPLFGTKILSPSPMFNALFLNHHALTHFLSEGIRLRHILDWALFLRSEQEHLDWDRFYALCEEYGMRAFVDCMTAMAVEVCGVAVVDKVVATTPHAECVLDSVLHDDSAVFSQNVGAWRKRMLLVRNLLASRWKYEAFADKGIMLQFITLVWGYLTHPEED